MSKSKDVENYPKYYFALYFRALEQDGHLIRCKTEKQAKRIQFDLYGFREAIYIKDPELGKQFKAFQLKVELNTETLGYDLVFSSKRPDDEVILASLGLPANFGGIESPTVEPEKEKPDILQDPQYRAMKGLPPLEEEGEEVEATPVTIAEEEEDINEQECYKKFMQPAEKEKG